MTHSTYGDAVSLTATISGGFGTLTGTVTFYEGSTVLGSGDLNGSSEATINYRFSAGSHSITAVYEGDFADNAGSESSTVEYVIDQAPLTITADNISMRPASQ